MYTAVASITHEDVNNARALTDCAEVDRSAEFGWNVALIGVPVLVLIAVALATRDPRLGLVGFAATFGVLSVHTGARRARRRKQYLVALLRALRLAGEQDVALTRRYAAFRQHHRSLVFIELVGMPALAALVAVTQLSIVLAPAFRTAGASLVSIAMLCIAALAIHLHRHHTGLRQHIRGALGNLPGATSDE